MINIDYLSILQSIISILLSRKLVGIIVKKLTVFRSGV